ncbi:MAG: hypothetical protein C4K48_02645 [Candidatus Thorarchaeota archaeon]|nr:MAG: hypothetical protein C4K48_02645 [Candidatus Thorarchaeota archaeon]
MLPGILILANLADIRQAAGYQSWTYFMPYPATAILFFALSLLVWLWQAYEDAREPEKSSGSTHDDADKKQT